MAVAFWICLGLVAFAYVGYPLLLAVAVRLVRHPPISEDVTPAVSLLIPAYNEERVLAAKLESCLALDYPKDRLQIVVLSDGSTDGTNAIAGRYADRGVELLAWDENRGKLDVVRDGIAGATGEIAVFSDAATLLAPDSLRLLVRPFADPQVGCVSSRYRVVNPQTAQLGHEEGFYWRYESFLKRCEGDLWSTLGAHGALYAIRRDLFPDLASDTINDDYVIPARIAAAGHRVVYEPAAVATEEASEMTGFARRVRIAVGNVQQLRLIGLFLWPPRPWLLFAFVSHKVLRLFGPFLLLAALGLNLFLPGTLYAVALAAQGGFYALALAGWALGERSFGIPLLKLPYYFCMINAAYVVGCLRVLVGAERLVWNAPPAEGQGGG